LRCCVRAILPHPAARSGRCYGAVLGEADEFSAVRGRPTATLASFAALALRGSRVPDVATVRRLWLYSTLYPAGSSGSDFAPCANRFGPKPIGSRMPTDELVTALGEAVAASWGKLPAAVQQTLFEAAIGSAGEGSREKLAIYLHDRHPRTPPGDKPRREGAEPDSLGG
jgi:hypothetical protein